MTTTEALAVKSSLPPINQERTYTVGEAALYLGLSESALRYQLTKGKAPRSGKIMGRRVFRGSDLTAFIEAAFEGAE